MRSLIGRLPRQTERVSLNSHRSSSLPPVPRTSGSHVPFGLMALFPRGGSNPRADATTTFPTTPPSSTYKSVPRVGGSFGGFVSLLVGLGFVLLLTLAVLALLRYRQIKRKDSASEHLVGTSTWRNSNTIDRGWEDGPGEGVDEEPFEMPSDYAAHEGTYGLSTMSLGKGGGYKDPFAESREDVGEEERRRKAEAVFDDLDEEEDHSRGRR